MSPVYIHQMLCMVLGLGQLPIALATKALIIEDTCTYLQADVAPCPGSTG
jgi:hypothetical protein